MICTPLNRVVDGAPSVAAVPVCVFAPVNAQLSAEVTLELLDDVLVDEPAELVLLEELEVADDDDELPAGLLLVDELTLLDELLLFATLLLDEPALDVELSPLDSEDPALHATMKKQRLARRLAKL